MVVVCDDEDRENEGDLTLAAQFATPEAINFMAKEGRGLICLSLTAERCDELGLDLMAAKNESPFETPFTVSSRRAKASPPASPRTTARTRSRWRSTPRAGPRDLVQPGHVFPLKSRAGGVLERAGQTEAAVDLARLAGLNPAGVICEVMNDDGTMARVPDLVEYCARHGLSMITVADLIAYRRRHDKLVERVVSTRLPTAFGDFEAVGYRSLVDDKHHVALVKGEVAGQRRRARARALGVPHRRRLPLAALRLRRAARIGAGDDRARGPGSAALPLPGGSRDRPAEQAARLPPAGGRPRHRRSQRASRAARRPARLRHRRPDPRRPRAQLDPDPDQQPEEDQRPRGLRAVGQRADPDRARTQRTQRGLPAHEGRADGPHPAPPGAQPRRRAAAASASSARAA